MNVFNAQILAEKLSKLNNSQQSIETLSHWCIFHRKKAKQVVETWDKLFNSSQKEQRVAFLYLANDILQNSRRKGSEFVNEFWKVLPAVLKDVYENGDDHGRKAVSRLVDIWEERKVFGSRGRSLKDEMLGKDPPPLLESNGKSSNSIKIVKKDAHSIRLKLAVGGMAEKIVTAFQAVHEEHFNEDTALNKCKAAVRRVEKMELDADNACTQGNQQGPTLANELQEQDNVLRQCIKQLESVEATRAALVAQLKEALQDQESKLELIHTQLQVAHSQIDQASNVRQRLTSARVSGPGQTTGTTLPAETLPIQPTSSVTQPPLMQPVTSFAASKSTAEEDHKKATAAAVAAKLAASTSSAQMLTSVLSSLVAEEAASMNGGTKRFGSSLPFSMEKRPKLEKPLPVSEMGSTAYFANVQQQSLTNSPLTPGPSSTTSMQPMSQASQVQPPFPPPPPPLPPPPAHIYAQSTGMIAGVMPYGYGGSSLPPPPPPLPTHVAMGLARPGTQPQQPVTGSYYRPSGMGFYGQNHQPATPPVPRQ
ncbi:regulation of nuclear pre-mRNA domain-containing protein 2-like isoform X2 [Macadamia integrifolia]|uniref:regulation of nuclear pre-mRNA domain-containing protein 2-like isoform X2 n=1 Tax=Macadamia integrifolia TaxID=60698 RepID=UPI001C4F0C58|nr:regulation of nuclear pre-mRNA domain-containing protein 2-like isoform X2 [Macadamia integrifolia]